MADFQRFGVSQEDDQNVTIPSWAITCLVTDSRMGTVLADFTGNAAIHFPACLSDLTTDQRDSIINQIVTQLVMMRAGLDDGSSD